MNMSVDGAFIYFTIPIFGGIPITQTTISFLLVTILLCWLSISLGKGLKKRPDGKQVLVEKGVMMLQNMVAETMGAHNIHWTPFIGTIFLSSLCGSFIGLTGFLRSATADLSCTLVWALMVTAIIWYNNIKNNGFVGWLISGILVLAAAVLGFLWHKKRSKAALIFGILSGVFGLFGLLQATGILSGVPILAFGLPGLLSCYFDLFSGFVQAYVFTLLTMVYISASLPDPEEKTAES